ncbi:MAG: hypothetical protein PHC83_04315 [Bacteroidales bacterium]|nr:hypothetical protein [Bacteroidales bacterium]
MIYKHITTRLKHFFEQFHIESFIVYFSMFVVSLLLLTFSQINFSLTTTDNPIFSQATLEGVDINKRVNMFYLLVFSACISFCILYFVSYLLFNILNITTKQKHHLSIINVLGIFAVISTIIGLNSHSYAIILLLCSLLLVILYTLYNKKATIFSAFGKETNIKFILGTSILLFFGCSFLFNSSAIFYNNYAIAFLLIVIFISILYFFFYTILKFNDSKIRLLLSSTAALPFLAFLSFEFYMYRNLNLNKFIDYKLLYLILYGCVLIFLFIFINSKKKHNFNTKKLLSVFIYPSIIINIILLTNYQVIFPQTEDMFELANPANAMMKIFVHHQIPFIDFITSHMLYEQWTGILYNTIFGYKGGLDFLTYKFLNTLFLFLISYHFFSKILRKSAYALLFLISFPFIINFLGNESFFVVFVFYSIMQLVKNQNTKNYLILYVCIIGLIIWRIDNGAAAIFSSLLFTPILFFTTKTKWKLIPFFKATAITSTVLLGAFALSFIMRSPDYIMGNLQSAFHYISSNQAHGYSQLVYNYTHQFLIYYIFIPTIAVLSSLFIIYTIRKNSYIDNHTFYLLSASLFFFIVFFINAQRGLVRHSFMEYTEFFFTSTFFLALILLSIYLFYTYNKRKQFIRFYASAFCLLFLLKFFPIENNNTMIQNAISCPSIKETDARLKKEKIRNRVLKSDDFKKNTFLDFKNFLDSNLSENQSFIDFSNTPMLYYYCQRKSPGYFCQNLQNTVDDYLQLQLLKHFDTHEFPVVVFSAYPLNWFDHTDGISNIMRYYLIAEYIFANYRPFCIINNKSIWTKKHASIHWKISETDTLINNPPFFDYKKAAYHWGTYLTQTDAPFYQNIYHEILENTKNKDNLTVSIPSYLSNIHHLFMLISINTPHETNNCYIKLKNQDREAGGFCFELIKGKYDYAIRLSNNYFWHNSEIDTIIIEKSKETEIKAIKVIKDYRVENQTSNIYR